MTEERADSVSRFQRQNVFELAGLLFDFGLVLDFQRLGKQPFRQTVTADDVCRALASAGSEIHDGVTVRRHAMHGMYDFVTAVQHRPVGVRLGGMRAKLQQSQFSHALDGDRNWQRARGLNSP
jgi:hypothetical protein